MIGNSKSEDTPESVSSCHKAPMVVVGGTEGTNHYECTKCNKPCNWVGPQDTSLDEYLIDLVDEHFPKGKSKERGQANVMLAYFVMWHKSEQAKLLQVIEDEVHLYQDTGVSFEYIPLEAIKKIKDNVINGGSL